MDITLPLDRMTLDEKYRLVDVLLDDIARQVGEFQPSPWHGRILKERSALIASGKATFIPLEDFEERTRDLLAAPQSPMDFAWAGGLSELRDQFGAVELQHQASNWR